jgi:hypothetical protein
MGVILGFSLEGKNTGYGYLMMKYRGRCLGPKWKKVTGGWTELFCNEIYDFLYTPNII